MYLVELNETNYRDYQRSMRKIKYSTELKVGNRIILQKEPTVEEENILSIPQFVDYVSNPDIAIYCLKDDNDNNMGIVSLVFRKNICYIGEFAVFEKQNGNGTKFYRMIFENAIQPRGSKEIRLYCPFAGAQEFWKKMGFHEVVRKVKQENGRTIFVPEFECKIK